METHARTLARAITYRIIALLITAFWTGLGDAVLIHLILTGVHYVIERVWQTITWGRRV
jgi:uncharacterized membrane protein